MPFETSNLQSDLIQDPQRFLEKMWEQGKIFSTLSKGIEMLVDGEECTVRHNKSFHDALLRISSKSESDQERLVLVEKCYTQKQSRKNRFQKPVIKGGEVAFDITCAIENEKGNVIVDCSGFSVIKLIELLSRIGQICDATKDIRRFEIQWDGDITQLLLNVVQNPSAESYYKMVRVTPDNKMYVYNYKYDGESSSQLQEEEKEIGSSLQRAIFVKEGLVHESDPEDISVLFNDPQILKMIKNAREVTKNDPSHPLFREVLYFIFVAVLQIKRVREKLSHLVPINPKETMSFRIDGSENGAFYKNSAGPRAGRHYVPIADNNAHSECVVGEDGFKYAEGQYIEIDPISISAELRHHIHYIAVSGNPNQHDTRDMRLPLWFAVTEFIDDMQYLPGQIEKVEGELTHGRLLFVRRDDYLLDVEYGDKSKKRFDMISLFDVECSKYLNGHDFTGFPLKRLAELIVEKYPNVSGEMIRKIEKAIFKFMLDLDMDQYIGDRLGILRESRNVKEGRREEYIIGKLLDLKESSPEFVEMSEEDFYALIVDFYEQYTKCEKLLTVWSRPSSRRTEKLVNNGLKKIEPEILKLREMLSRICPYKAPNGKDYPSMLAYTLDPEVLFEVVCKEVPELS